MAYKRVIKSLQGIRENYLQNIEIVSREQLWDKLEWITLGLLVPVAAILSIIIYGGIIWIMK